MKFRGRACGLANKVSFTFAIPLAYFLVHSYNTKDTKENFQWLAVLQYLLPHGIEQANFTIGTTVLLLLAVILLTLESYLKVEKRSRAFKPYGYWLYRFCFVSISQFLPMGDIRRLLHYSFLLEP